VNAYSFSVSSAQLPAKNYYLTEPDEMGKLGEIKKPDCKARLKVRIL